MNGHTYLEHYRGRALNLTGWWGHRGNIRVLGNFMILMHVTGDTVFAVWSDSANNTLSLTAGGGIGIKKWLKIGTHLAFITTESDTFYCSTANDSTQF